MFGEPFWLLEPSPYQIFTRSDNDRKVDQKDSEEYDSQ
ncbi:hypothetical protein HMPREF9950_0077 [Streptococcus oralis SK313]|uniref:Uncharacterized protein n=1 Tax=Streptococcus oralis SK313 TaxID=1035190 RepID=F9Q054_STROR|nr:hypothetical protein HMPREF9950_0077 [Streptococcus oralis SK313]